MARLMPFATTSPQPRDGEVPFIRWAVMKRLCLIVLICLYGGFHLAVAADTSADGLSKIARDRPTANKYKVGATKTSPPTCSPAWLDLLDKQCDESDTTCAVMLDKARSLLDRQRAVMTHVLVNSAEFSNIEGIWNKYRDAECEALVPQCPEGTSGACNLPSAICEVQMDCEHIVHLRTAECQTNDYNRSLRAPPKPNACR
jgi:hypothetical protein